MRPPALPLVLALAACDPGEDTGRPDDTGDPPPQVALSDADNFAFTSAVDVSAQAIRAGADITVEWPALTTDVYGQPLDPAALTGVEVFNFPGATADFLAALTMGSLRATDITLRAHCDTSGTSCQLDEFLMGEAHPLDLSADFLAGSGGWVFALRSSAMNGPVAYIDVVPTEGSDDLAASFSDGGSSFRVDATAAAPVPVADPSTVLDWSALTLDGAGNALPLYRLDRAVLARFSGGADVPLAAPQFLSESADEAFTLDVTGRGSVALPEFLADPLAGDGAWVFALLCSSCDTRMPAFLAVLEVAAP